MEFKGSPNGFDRESQMGLIGSPKGIDGESKGIDGESKRD